MLETQKIPYALGIDVGSTTVKTVLLTEMGEVLSSSYERHFSKVRETVCTKLASLAQEYPDIQLRVSITGSAGLGLAQAAGLPFVQEVHAAFLAVKRRYPEADVVIELGGEDAKIIFLTGGVEQRMNGSCAGGTGAFIDQMATLLDVSVDQLDKMAQAAEKVYPIASRCGVFAKSDIQPLLNQGARREDIAASIFQAVVDQTVSGLAQGRRITGLNTANPEVQKYFCDVGAYWVREYGIDGWRLDVASEVNDGFWRAFRDAVKGENPEALLIGEVLWWTRRFPVWHRADALPETCCFWAARCRSCKGCGTPLPERWNWTKNTPCSPKTAEPLWHTAVPCLHRP